MESIKLMKKNIHTTVNLRLISTQETTNTEKAAIEQP